MESLIKDSEFLGEVVNHDLYFDYPDLRMFKKEVRLRKRNDKFELKIGDDEDLGIAEEIEDDKEIEGYLKLNKSLKEFVEEDLIEIIDFKTKRIKYKKGEFNIDVDELDFGYKCVEIETMVKDKSQIKEAQENIIELAKSYNFEIKPIISKRKEYFRLLKPEMYKELYGN